MVVRLALYLIVMMTPVAIIGTVAYRRMIGPRLLERRARRRAELNAEHSCIVCFRLVDTDADDAVYEKGWMHDECRRRLLA